jgi:superfamily II DNA or RNA helicase
MLARVSNNKWIIIEQITVPEEDILDKAFSVRHPRAQYIDTSNGFFDGVYHKYNKFHHRLARPLWRELQAVCKAKGLPLGYADDRPAPKYPTPKPEAITKDMLEGCELYDYQVDAIKSICHNEVGIISLVTGGGKCVTGESKIILNNIEMPIRNLFSDVGDEQYVDVSKFGLKVYGAAGHIPIKAIYKTEPREIIRIDCESGHVVRGVSEHRVYTKYGWKFIKDLNNYDEIQIHSRECVGDGDRWVNNSEANESFGEKAEGTNSDGPLYKITVCELQTNHRKVAKEFYPECSEVYSPIVSHLYTIYEYEEKNGRPPSSLPTCEAQLGKTCRTFEEQQSDEESASCSQSNGYMHEKVRGHGSCQFAACGQIGECCQSEGHKNSKWDDSIIAERNRQIQGDYGIQTSGRDRKDKSQEISNLAQKSFDIRKHKRVIFKSTQNQNSPCNDQIREFNIPEQVRTAIYSCLRGIKSRDWFREGSNDKIREFVVYFGFPITNSKSPNDNRNQISISIRTEDGTDITEEAGCRNLCSKEFNDISSSRVQQATKDGFFSDRYAWSKIAGIKNDGIENCYDLQVNHGSHAYWTNGILSHNTEIMAGIAKALDCPTVILCEMTVVVDQIKERLELRKVVEEVGMFYAGKRPNGQQIIVGSFQSLIIPSAPKKTKRDTAESYAKKMKGFKTRRKNAQKLRNIIGKCDLLLVDECDSATSKKWKQLFWHWFKGRRRYGFSGTPFDVDKPVANIVLKEHLGSVIFHVSREHVESTNRIVPVSYTAIAFGNDENIRDKTAYDIAMKEQMIENTSFHKIVMKLAKRSTEDPTFGTLVLVESKPLGYALESIIEGSQFICGDHRMKARKAAVSAFEKRETQVLIGGKIVKRGLDLKGGCETLIIATGGKLASDFNQKVGRALRVNSRGRAQIYDFYFLGNHYLYGHSRRRLKTIVDMGYPAKVVFKGGVIEARRFIKARFRRPKG